VHDSPNTGERGLIGRDSERAELRNALVRSRVVLVYGAAGVGKTALVIHVCAAAAEERIVPPVVHLSLAGVADPREAVERTAKALGEPRPTPSPERVTDALAALLASSPRTIIWDDMDARSEPLGELVHRFHKADGASRLVIVSRRYITAREATMRAPALEVKPLTHEDALRLVHAIEVERGRTLADDLVTATGGNPLLLRVALAETALPRVAADANDAFRRSLEEHTTGAGRRVVSLLAAAETSLDAAEVARVVGRGGAEAVDDLRKHLVVQRDGARISLAAPALAIARSVLGDADDATWKTLAKLAERGLAASPHDDGALVLAARAHLATGNADAALAVLREHPLARASAPTSALERLLREIAKTAREHASVALRLLAREQLRAADYDSARQTLDDLPRPSSREDAERIALLRAETHIRAGEPEAAQRALDALERAFASDVANANADAKASKNKKKSSVAATPHAENPGIVLTRAELAILRGELASARATLEALAPQTRAVPQLEARRAVEIAASHLYAERYETTHEWTSRARAAQKAAGIPVEHVVTILDVHALLGLGEVDRAEEVLARETRGREDAAALELAALVRRGEHVRALEVGDGVVAALDRRADLLFRSVLARDLTRACIATGQLARAERMLRLAEAAADEPGLAALRPICDAERARLAEAEGDLPRARRAIDRAHARIPESPFVAIDREVLSGRVPTPPGALSDLPRVVRAYASLRTSELLLASDDTLLDALEAAELAERYHSMARLWHETARARLVRAEAVVRMQADPRRSDAERDALRERAEQSLRACEDVAAQHGYAPILAAAGVVRAALHESRGELESASRAIEGAVRDAGEGADTALVRAAARLGVLARDPRGDAASRRPYAARVERLGLLRAADVVWRVGSRAYLTQGDDGPPEAIACVVDFEARRVRAGAGRELELPEQRIALLSALAEAGETGASLEEIFARVWGGTFHPLRHRNAVYVALARLKDSLKPLARDVRITHDGDRYRLTGPLPVGVRRRASKGGVRSALARD